MAIVAVLFRTWAKLGPAKLTLWQKMTATIASKIYPHNRMTQRSTTKCNICFKEMRSDLLIRHMLVHKKNIDTICSEGHIKTCLSNRWPIFIPIDKSVAICLICKKYALGKSAVKDFVDNFTTPKGQYIHRNCIQQFDTVKYYFDKSIAKPKETNQPTNQIVTFAVPESNELKDKIVQLEKTNTELQKQNKLLEDRLLVVQEQLDRKPIDDLESKYNELLNEVDEITADCAKESRMKKDFEEMLEKALSVIDIVIKNERAIKYIDEYDLDKMRSISSDYDNYYQ